MSQSRSTSSRSPGERSATGTGPENTREEPDRSLDEADRLEKRRREREAAAIRSQLDALKSFSDVIANEFAAGKTRQQYALDMQHATYLDIVRDLERSLKEVQAQRDAMQRRAEAAEAKVEILASKIATLIRRTQQNEEMELRAFAERVSQEKKMLMEVVSGFARELGVDPSPIVQTSSTIAPTIADATALLDCVRANHIARTQAILHAAKPMPTFARDLNEKMSMAVIMINRRLNHEDVVTGTPLPNSNRQVPSDADHGTTQVQRLDAEHWEIGRPNQPLFAHQHNERTPSNHSVNIDDDEDIFDALRLVLTDGLVALRAVEEQVNAVNKVATIVSNPTPTDATYHHQAAVARLTKQLETQLSRHAQFRAVSQAMLDAAESEYLLLLQRRLGIPIDTTTASAEYNRAIQAAAHAEQARLTADATEAHQQHQFSQRRGPVVEPSPAPLAGKRMLSPPSSYE